MAEIEISKINSLTEADPEGLVLSAEKRYKDFIRSVADAVLENSNIKIILLAGPSGSGKTTTANILTDEIRARGLSSLVVSLDDFYRNATDPEYPRLPDGERDFEAVEALNLPDIEDTLLAISEGREFSVPRYDFKIGARSGYVNYPEISHGCVIIEGLHALNPIICKSLDTGRAIRIFISVSTNINEGGARIMSGRNMRFCRRMVRDSIYRNADAERTLGMWENVILGEEKYLYPYRPLADFDFDTFHAFEPGIMKKYAEALISEELCERSPYAKRVLSALKKAVAIDEALVPEDSLIREFIQGGKYEEFY